MLLKKFFFFLWVFNICVSLPIIAQTKIIDSFDNLSTWQKTASDGAKMSISLVDGVRGKAIKIDYKFTGAGYCGIVKKIPMKLSANYKFNFFVKGNSPKNNLEFKLDDSSGDNVWWYVFRRFDFPNDWTEKTVRERQISFAWGPIGGGKISDLNKIEIIISAAAGGSGTVYIDELTFTQLPVIVTNNITPSVVTSSTLKGKPSFIFDGNIKTEWRSNKNENQSLIIDFQYLREYGGLIIKWDSLDYASDYYIEASNDKENWQKIYAAKNQSGVLSFIPLQDNESKYLRVNLIKSSRQKGYAIKEIIIEDYKFSEDDNYRFGKIAECYPDGYFPKYFLNKQTYWNVIGVSGGDKKGLINEEGMIETDKENFSVEPFLYSGSKFITWDNVTIKQNLENGYLPISKVTWTNNNFDLNIKAFADGNPDTSSIYVRYLIKNKSGKIKTGNLYLAVRPFQVNPPWQNLNTTGGIAKINSIEYKKSEAIINNAHEIISVTKPSNFGATAFNNGSIINYISKDELPKNSVIQDKEGFASGAFQYSFKLNPGETYDVVLVIPFNRDKSFSLPKEYVRSADSLYDQHLNNITKFWEDKLNTVKITLPPYENKLVNTLRSNVAYILINRNKAALQPGSRCYDRAWIRDGALMAESLLRMGITEEVKDFINWYSKYQFPSGKIPCAVDSRGADPVPENDSQGEYIYLLNEYFNFTKDTSMLLSHWENVKGAVNYIKYQIGEESTELNKNGNNEQKSFYGLVPASISHEGYSAKPMHSYWDDFFVMKGLKDAVSIAEILGKQTEVEEYSGLKNDFRKNLYHSINLAMKNENVNYIPGCAELGDFDATSTTIAISPCDELKYLPEPALKNTFDKYYNNFQKRLSPKDSWINYTPYEIRVAETFVYLNKINRTYNLLNFFLKDQRPEGWNHWAEVVWKDKDAPKFIGDMPHTWVGSAYVNTIRTLFVYEDENDSALILASGVKEEWLNSPSGVSVSNMPTYYGTVSYSIKKNNNKITISLDNELNPSCKKIIFKPFLNQKIKNVIVDGKYVNSFSDSSISINPSSKKITIDY